MRIAVDINHPAHVHYFKNFIRVMKERGHEILVTASNKEISYKLLKLYNIEYIPLGSYGSSFLEKMFKVIWLDIKMYLAVRKFRPDVFIGFASARCAHTAFFMRKKSLIITDTEPAREQILLVKPFATFLVTPSAFLLNLGKKQIRFNSFLELMYLHPNVFIPDRSVLEDVGLKPHDKFVIVRFVAFHATHDFGHSGIDNQNKLRLLEEIEKYAQVVITSEQELPVEFDKYRKNLPLDKIHHLLYFASLYVGEGVTMTSEAAVLGTHSIHINHMTMGYIREEEEKYDLVNQFYSFDSVTIDKILEKTIELLSDPELKKKSRAKRDKLLKEKIDTTEWFAEFVEAKLLPKA